MENKNLKIGDSIREAKDAELREKLNEKHTAETPTTRCSWNEMGCASPETPKAPETPTLITGKVIDCTCLNMRNANSIDAKIVAVIGAGSIVTINESKSTPDWYYVTNEDGVEGFCMKSYIAEKK